MRWWGEGAGGGRVCVGGVRVLEGKGVRWWGEIWVAHVSVSVFTTW